MITIRVVSCNGKAPAQPLAVEFDELGGTIGRAETNQLVLPDPERHISRLQARVEWHNGRFEIANVGANPLDVAGQSVANGGSAPLKPGDRISVGGYLLEVSAAGSGAAPSPSAGSAAASAAKEDVLGLFGGISPAGAGEDPFASILAGAVGAAPQPSAKATEPPARSSVAAPAPSAPADAHPPAPLIPEDFEPFADPFAQRPAAKEAAHSHNLDDLGFGASGESVSGPGISTIFGLERGARTSSADLLSGTPLAAPAPGKDDKGALLDPLAALSGAAPAEPKRAAVPDQVPEIRAAYRPPAAKLPDDAFLSWEQAGPGKAAGSAEHAEAPPVRPRVDVEIMPSPQTSAETAKGSERLPGAEAVPEPHPTPVAPPAGESDALLQAFLQGLGLPGLKLEQGLTPEAMQTIGQLLREATQGTLDLLLARATTKREVRAEVTMIVSRDNNPLKFSPSVEVALMHLLAPQGRGFLPPLAAMRDAWDDLRAHQLGFMAGMRAALAGVLQRFDPVALEQRLSAKSVLDSLLPMNRRAHLWELYLSLYREIASEAEDDFHALFGREFVRAYEEQVRRLHARDE